MVKTPEAPAFALCATARQAEPQDLTPSELQMELDRLAQENADLRGSTQIWIRMYEQLLGFYLKGRVPDLPSCTAGRS
jgi:hypothetical protein